MCKARQALNYSCEVQLQSIYKEKEEEKFHKSSFKIKYCGIISVWQCTGRVRTLQLLRLKTFSNKLCQLCTVSSSEALWCSGGFAQYSVWFQNRIQRNKFSCRVIIAAMTFLALHDTPQATSREGNTGLPWPWLQKCSFPVFVSDWSFQTTEFHEVWTWICGSFHWGLVVLHWMGMILLVLVLLLDKSFSAFSCRSQRMLGSLLTSSWAWRTNPRWTSLPGVAVWHSLQARYESYIPWKRWV